jgi:Fuc2NAc and GlcNAc transferase
MSTSWSAWVGAAAGGVAVFLFSCWLTAWVRRYALRAQLLDVPNERSSHSAPTPRGGGVAIVVSTLLATVALAALGWTDLRLALGLGVGGALVALLGFIDDKRGLSARVRFAGHLLAATGAVALIAPLPPLEAFWTPVQLGWVALPLAIIYVVWSVNLFNFMDGIDGIAAMEGISVAAGGALISAMLPGASGWLVGLIFAASIAGFLVFNFPPASIFMGDAGSGFLGFVVGVMTLWAATQEPQLLWSWLILSSCFLVDATTTLLRRVKRGESFHVAHRNHAYQYASRRHGSHKVVTLAVLAINLLWLFPWALAVGLRWIDGALGAACAMVPVVALVYRYKAGDRKAQGAG